MLFYILKAEMFKKNISILELSKKIGVSEKTLRNKLNGSTEFRWSEIKKIRDIVAPEMKIEDLFETIQKSA